MHQIQSNETTITLIHLSQKPRWVLFTFGVSITQNDNFLPGRGSGSGLVQSGQEVASKEVGGHIGVRDPLSLNRSANFGLGCKCSFCWLNSMNSIHVVSKLRWEKPLKPNDTFTIATQKTRTQEAKTEKTKIKDRNFYLNIASFLDSSDDRTLISQLSVTHCWNHHIDLLYRLHKALMVVEITLKTITKNNRTKIKQNPNVRSSWKIWKRYEILHTKTKLTPKDLKFSMTLALAGLERVGSRTRA